VKIFTLNTNRSFHERNLNLTIGNFDGIHLGHQSVIKQLTDISKSHNFQSALLSFNPHPREFFSTFKEPFNIITPSFKKILFEKLGLDIYINFEFDKALASLRPDEFIQRILVEKLSIKSIILGTDFKFGKDRKGDLLLIKEKAQEYQFNVTVIKPVIEANSKQKYSSSIIRKHIKNGMFEKVTDALGRHWHMSGKVILGDQRGQKSGFPTANLEPGHHILPLKGVYCVYASIDGKQHKGIANFGERPTVDGTKLLLETHIFDFNGDIYGKELTVEFLTFIRAEQKFDNFEKLKEQIKKDIQTARTYHKI
jgi:riboflavin kinase/FMN adenylyltransferase